MRSCMYSTLLYLPSNQTTNSKYLLYSTYSPVWQRGIKCSRFVARTTLEYGGSNHVQVYPPLSTLGI